MTDQPKAPTASGWYDDPQDPSQLRYWDGILWSDRVMPKLRPGLDHVGQARPVDPTKSLRAVPRGESGPGPHPAPRHPENTGRQQHFQGPQFAGHDPRMQPFGNTVGRPSGLWRRILAVVLDRFIVGIPVALAVLPFLSAWVDDFHAYLDRVQTAAAEGAQMPSIPEALLTAPPALTLAIVAAMLVYETLMISRLGATLGKKIMGIRVVPSGVEPLSTARLSAGRSLLRACVKAVPDLRGLVAALAALGGLLQVAIILWALTNPLRRGLDDLTAGSEVRRTR